MRLWHQDLIRKLDRQRLLAQHRELCALRGNGWTKKHSTVQYALNSSLMTLYTFHMLVVEEMYKRGYDVNKSWIDPTYRGKYCAAATPSQLLNGYIFRCDTIYPEHDNRYMEECLTNLKNKGVDVTSFNIKEK